MKTITTIAAFALGIVAISGVALAFGQGQMGLDSENREAVMSAIEAGDYEAWKEAMSNQFTEEEFNRIREMEQNRQQIESAIQEGNYEAWKEAVENNQRPRITEVITEENFDIYVQMQEAKMSGDFETANQLAEELGIDCGEGMFGGMRGRHMGGGSVPLMGD